MLTSIFGHSRIVMQHKDLRNELTEEVSAILDSQFSISITETRIVPQQDDPAITFPNVDTRTQGAKMIRTCVLYIDMRKSTDLNLAHRPQTLAKLYTSFVRAMTRIARYYGGHVRGIIGDRVMVLFDVDSCFANAVNCAIAMNTVAKHILNKNFQANEVMFGIGIDYGRMLVTKAGIRRHGSEQGNYKNLVWLGRPANVASKLTDAANKPTEYDEIEKVHVAYERRTPPVWAGSGLLGAIGVGSAEVASSPRSLGGPFGLAAAVQGTGSSPYGILTAPNASPSGIRYAPISSGAQIAPSEGKGWEWFTETPSAFLSQLEVQYCPSRITHKRSDFGSFCVVSERVEIKAGTPPILMTKAVWNGFKKERPNSAAVQKALFKKIDIVVTGYTDEIYGGRAEFPGLRM